MNYFSKNLRFLRKRLNLDQEQLGERVGLTKNTISQYENEKKIPTVNNLEKVAKFFKVKPGEIIDYDLTNPNYNPQSKTPISRDYEKLINVKDQLIESSEELIDDLKRGKAQSEEFITRLKQQISVKDNELVKLNKEIERLKKRITELEKA